MASDFEKTVIVNVVADPSNAKAQMVELDAEIKKLTNSNKALKKELEAAMNEGNTEKVKQLTGAIIENDATLKSLRSTSNQVQRQLMSNSQSMDELRAKTALMTKQANQFKVVTAEDKIELEKLQAAILKNNKAIVDFDTKMGNTKSSVGNYKQAIIEAIKGNGGMTNSIYSMGAAVTANPLGMLVMLVVKLIDQLHKVQPVMDFFNEAVGSASAVIDVLVARAGNLIKAMVALWNWDYAEAANQFSAATTGVGEALSEAVVAGREFAKMQKELDDNFQVQSLQMEANETRMKGLLKQLNDTTKSEKERLKTAEEIQKLENENLKILEDKAKGELTLARQQLINALDRDDQAKAQKMSDAELLKLGQDKAKQDTLLNTLAEKSVALEKLRGESISLTEKVEARANAIRQKAEEDRQRAREKAEAQRKKDEEARLKAEEDRKKAAEKAAKDFDDLSKKEYETQQKTTKLIYDQQQQQLKQQLADRLITEEQFNELSKQNQLSRLNNELLNMQDYAETAKLTAEDLAAKELEIANYKTDQQIALNQKLTAKDKEERQKQIAEAQAQAQLTGAFVESIGQTFASSLEDQNLNMRKFSKGVIATVLDMIEKIVLAQVAAASATSLAQPDSVATFGATGLIRAAVMTGLIKGAFSVAKSQINAYAKGTDYSKPGLALVGEEGPELVQLPQGSRVFTAPQTRAMLPFAGAFANGGVVGDGGYAARSISNQVTNSFMPDFSKMKFNLSIHEFLTKESNIEITDNISKWG